MNAPHTATVQADAAAATSRSLTVVVTGATGYVGGRLVPRLLAAGHRVRCFVREPRKLDARPWRHAPGVDVRCVDIEDADAVAEAARGADAAYYLVHSMIVQGRDYRRRDIDLARSFAAGVARAKISRLVYLGGLGELGANLSEHLMSRREVEYVLADAGVPLTVFRAAMIVGAGSASFEILRYLVEHLPIMVTPRWVRTQSQPIAIGNVLHYLVACLQEPATAGQTIDIGGPEYSRAHELMRTMARARGLPPRWILPVPVLTPRLSSIWIHLVTPVPHSIARPLAEGLRNRTVCRDDLAAKWMPQRLLTMREAIDAALTEHREASVETMWTDAGALPGDPAWSGGTVRSDVRTQRVDAPPDVVYAALAAVGGDTGWYGGTWLWRLRGFFDRLVGGPGLRRGRRDPVHLEVGDALDFWRVVDVVPGHHIELRAEMRLPGEATLKLAVAPEGTATQLTLTARFRPRGLSGLAYWYAVLPLHTLVFHGLLRGLARVAEAKWRTDPAAAVKLGRQCH